LSEIQFEWLFSRNQIIFELANNNSLEQIELTFWYNMIQQQEAKLIEQIELGLLQVAEQEERKLDQQIRNLEDLSEFCAV
jgi:hypothetical protein